jgi:hypothetical protein
MQAILRALYAPGFRFMSLGCARRPFPCHDTKPGEPTHLGDGYIQVAYRDSVLNTDPARFVTLAQVILSRIGPSAEHHIQFVMTVEPLRSFFKDESRPVDTETRKLLHLLRGTTPPNRLRPCLPAYEASRPRCQPAHPINNREAGAY